MKKSQLNAISYSYAAKQARDREEDLNEKRLKAVFEYQSIYKTLGGFLKASDKLLKRCAKQALSNAETRKAQLEKCGCTSYKYDEVLSAIEEIKMVVNAN